MTIWRWTNLMALTVIALGIWTAFLSVAYFLHAAGVERFRVESAALLFVVAGLVLKFGRQSRASRSAQGRPGVLPAWTWLAFILIATTLYRDAILIGYLSDDFVLSERASHWMLGPVTPLLFRPLPLLLWAVVSWVGGGAVVLHMLAIALHGTNAYLTARVASEWTDGSLWSVAAGLLFLVSPLGPEAVAWCSGIFDVLATTCVLSAILVARKYSDAPSASTRVAFVAVNVAAVASKETAAVGIVLVLIDAWLRRTRSRALLVDGGVVALFMLVVGIIRLAGAPGLSSPPITRYLLQRDLFGTFGALIDPWHANILQHRPWIPIASALAVICLSLGFLLSAEPVRRLSSAGAAVLFVLLPVMPVVRLFFVGADLQGARYLYMAGVGWALLIAVLGAQTMRHWRRAAAGFVSLLLVTSMFGVMWHVLPWQAAAAMRDKVMLEATRHVTAGCDEISVANLPDAVQGAYVFRNGVPQAFARTLGLHVVSGHVAGGCSLVWNDLTSSFDSPSPGR